MINNILKNFNLQVYKIYPRASIKFMKQLFKGREVVGVEIGTYKGDNALSILKELNIKKLYLIDPYEDYDDYKEGKQTYNTKKSSLQEAEKEAHEKLKDYNNVKFIKMTSTEALKIIPDNLDFVYIDGNHSYKYVKEDILNYYPKLKENGVLAGHDIENGVICIEHTNVIIAFMEFIQEYKIKPYILSPDWWVIKEKRRLK